MWGIQFLSTIPERILLLVACSTAMAFVFFMARRAGSSQPFVPVVGTFVVFRVLYQIFPRTYAADIALFLALLIMVMIKLPTWRRHNDEELREHPLGAVRGLFSVILIPLFGVVLLNGWSLRGLARDLHRDEAVQQFAQGDSNGLALDTENGLLYVSGHGIEYLLAYDVKDLSRAPYRSPVGTDWAQSFHYNPNAQELYVFNHHDGALLILKAKTLDLKRSSTGLQITQGDTRIVYDGRSDSIIMASEGNYWGSPSDQDGYPIAIIARKTGLLAYTLKDCDGLCIPGLIYMHPAKPLLYMAFPQRVLSYDIETRKIARTPVYNQWVDGLVVTPDGKEVLVGAPLHSAVWRFDAESLEFRGSIPTVFGVRSIAVDPERNLLLAASLATNMLEVIDLKTYERAAQYYVGPWLRDISLDTKGGIAYVSSVQGLFKVHYTARLNRRQGE
jgi:DNA-binding beta-propeller fold protein YncE